MDGCTVFLSNDPAACDTLIEQFGWLSAAHVGFDLEWTPTMVRGQETEVSLLQLATADQCLLVRIGHWRSAPASTATSQLPPVLASLLASDAPLKVGRGVRADAKLLRAQCGVEPSGVSELPGRANLKELARTQTSLRLPAGVQADKGWLTNWDARELSQTALQYAAFDAVAAYEVHRANPLPPPRR